MSVNEQARGRSLTATALLLHALGTFEFPRTANAGRSVSETLLLGSSSHGPPYEPDNMSIGFQSPLSRNLGVCSFPGVGSPRPPALTAGPPVYAHCLRWPCTRTCL